MVKNIIKTGVLACRIVIGYIAFAFVFLVAVIWRYVKQAARWVALRYQRRSRPKGSIVWPEYLDNREVYFKDKMLDEESACQILSYMGRLLLPNRPQHIIHVPEVPGYLLCYQGIFQNQAGLITPAEMPDFWYYRAGNVSVEVDGGGSDDVYTEYGVYWFETPGELAVLLHVFPSIQDHLDKVGFRLLTSEERRERVYAMMPPDVKKATDNLREALYENFNKTAAVEDGAGVSHDI